jgi:hypothetical protein
MSTASDPPSQLKKWGNPPVHDIVESNSTAHKALELAEKLEEKMLVNPLKFLGEAKEKSWAGIVIGGVLAFICLVGASFKRTSGLLASTEHNFLIGGLMICAAIGIGIFFIGLSCLEFLGNKIIFVSLFTSTLALGVGIFMTIVSVRSRTIPG